MQRKYVKNRLIGDFLIIFSLLMIGWMYYPIFSLYLLPRSVDLKDSSYYIEIPKINAVSPIVENVDPRDKNEYKKALQQGVASAKGMNNFLFAHSSLPPWEMTRTNTPFLRLGELEYGDQIIIHEDGKNYTYGVEYKKEVWPDEVSFLLENQENQLILQTCTPIGTDFKRLLVFARITLPQTR